VSACFTITKSESRKCFKKKDPRNGYSFPVEQYAVKEGWTGKSKRHWCPQSTWEEEECRKAKQIECQCLKLTFVLRMIKKSMRMVTDV